MTTTDTEISVVLPCHNEQDNLQPLIAAIRTALDPLKRATKSSSPTTKAATGVGRCYKRCALRFRNFALNVSRNNPVNPPRSGRECARPAARLSSH